MSWRDDLRPGSFRGVAFKTEASDTGFGRRNVQHEYPQRDKPYGEDLGRKQRRFSIEAYVIGEDYMRRRDALIEACEKKGPGELIHPYHGTRRVTCDACQVHESTREGRMARLSLTFAEAGERIFPAAGSDVVSRLGIAGSALISASEGSFTAVHGVLGHPQFVADRVTLQIQELSSTLDGFRGTADEVAGFSYMVQKLGTDAVSLTTQPAELASRISEAIGAVADLPFDYGRIVSTYQELFEFGDDESVEAFAPTPAATQDTPSRRQEAINTEAILNHVRINAVVGAAVAAAKKVQQPYQSALDEVEAPQEGWGYATHQDAIAERDVILEVIDELAETVSDEVYSSLQDVRAAVAEAIPPLDKDLPNLVTIRNQQTRPSLSIAYDLYESVDREQEIVERNQVEHPGFVPGGVDLEVIRDG